jgi:hypothetical protein
MRGPNLFTQQRTASQLTEIPRGAINSSTSQMLKVKRKYSQTACRTTSGGIDDA